MTLFQGEQFERDNYFIQYTTQLLHSGNYYLTIPQTLTCFGLNKIAPPPTKKRKEKKFNIKWGITLNRWHGLDFEEITLLILIASTYNAS